MPEKPSVGEFYAFQSILKVARLTDLANDPAILECTSKEKRILSRDFGRDVRYPRTDEEILRDLAAGGERCKPNQALMVMKGIAKKRWKRHKDQYELDYRQGAKSRKRMNQIMETVAQWIRWFSGKRYGLVLDPDIAEAAFESDIDLCGLDVSIPWSPMLIKAPHVEYFLWQEGQVAYYTVFTHTDNDEAALTIEKRPVEHDKDALRAWLCAISKGEGKDDCFELRVGKATVALLPKLNAKTFMLKHKIAKEAETDRGSWVRKGHFRMTKDGPSWIDGAMYRKELPYVQKVHTLSKKGCAPKEQNLFG
jgi:hypothetical protein